MTDEDPDAAFLPVAEERLTVDVRRVRTGGLRVQVLTDTREEAVSADLVTEAVEVTRVPMDREVTEAPAVRVEGDVTIVPVLEEVLVVERRLFLREEVHLRRVSRTETHGDTVPLRRQRVVIDRMDAVPPDPTTNEDDEDERL